MKTIKIKIITIHLIVTEIKVINKKMKISVIIWKIKSSY